LVCSIPSVAPRSCTWPSPGRTVIKSAGLPSHIQCRRSCIPDYTHVTGARSTAFSTVACRRCVPRPPRHRVEHCSLVPTISDANGCANGASARTVSLVNPQRNLQRRAETLMTTDPYSFRDRACRHAQSQVATVHVRVSDVGPFTVAPSEDRDAFGG